MGLFSELDCSIEQEFCKAQEEEDSKQVLQRREQNPKAENKPWSTHSHPQGSGQVVMNCYLLLSSVMSLIAAHTLWAATCTFNRLRTPIPQSKPHSAHLLITTGVYTLLTCLSYFLLFIPSVVMCCTSSSSSAPNATLPNLHQCCRQWQTGLAGGGLSPATVEEKRDQVFSTCNFKQLSGHLSGRGSYFFSDVKRDPWDKFCGRNERPVQTFSHISRVAKLWHLAKDLIIYALYVNLPWGSVSPETWVVRKSPQDRLLI